MKTAAIIVVTLVSLGTLWLLYERERHQDQLYLAELQSVSSEFRRFMAIHKKSYPSVQGLNKRHNIMMENLRIIKEFNAHSTSYKLGIN